MEFHKNVVELKVGQRITRNDLLHRLVTSLYSRAVTDFKRGNFRVKGDTVDIHLAYADHAVRVEFWDDEIERLSTIDPESGQLLHSFDQFTIYPANLFVNSKETTNTAVWEIQQDLEKQKAFFNEQSRFFESKRLDERTLYDLEMIKGKLGSVPALRITPGISTEDSPVNGRSVCWTTSPRTSWWSSTRVT